jgi:prepilin-type N-terminal cleavage/methylation domain-containing protein
MPISRAGTCPTERQAGFTLVEVALAIAVIAFAFVALLSLLPAGLTTFRRALDISICTQIAQRIVADAQGADFDLVVDRENLPASSEGTEFSFRAPTIESPGIRFFDEQGNEIVPKAASGGIAKDWGDLSPDEQLRAIYHVNVRVIPRVNMPTDSGAGGADGFGIRRAQGEMGSLALLTVQIAHNPSGAQLKLKEAEADDENVADRNLWKPRDGVEMFTYSAYIARNQ